MNLNLRLLLIISFSVAPFWLAGDAQAQNVRRLAPGVVTVIPPEPNEQETYLGPLAIGGLTTFKWTPSYSPDSATLSDRASQVTLRHNIWNLEFAFKPVRMAHIDIPQPTGKMQRKLVWYMVYRIRNLGGHFHPVAQADAFQHTTFTTGKEDSVLNVGAAQPSASIRFFPHFVMESREAGKAYLDQIIPVAIPILQMREMRGAKLYNSVEISTVPIQVSRTEDENAIWGVATWMDVDPSIDYFSIQIQGLTNAFRTEATPQGKVAYRMKTLQLNFWRPGDSVYEHEKEIRYGIRPVSNEKEQIEINAKYGVRQRLDHLWVYR